MRQYIGALVDRGYDRACALVDRGYERAGAFVDHMHHVSCQSPVCLP